MSADTDGAWNMADELIIRPARENDLDTLLPLYRHLVPEDPPLERSTAADILERLSRYPGSGVLVGIYGNIVAATCTLVIVPNLTRAGAPFALIENVVTDPEYRNRGIGKAIVEDALRIAWDHDCYKVMLLTGTNNPATLAFYHDIGFEQTKRGFQIRRIPPTADERDPIKSHGG